MSSPAFADEPIPSYYGIYAVEAGKLIDLQTFANRPVSEAAFGSQVYFLLFHKLVNVGAGSAATLHALGYQRYRLHVYGWQADPDKAPLRITERIPVNKLTFPNMLGIQPDCNRDIPLRGAPVPGQAEMIKLVPAQPLSPGYYYISTAVASYAFVVRPAEINLDQICYDFYVPLAGDALGVYKPCSRLGGSVGPQGNTARPAPPPAPPPPVPAPGALRQSDTSRSGDSGQTRRAQSEQLAVLAVDGIDLSYLPQFIPVISIAVKNLNAVTSHDPFGYLFDALTRAGVHGVFKVPWTRNPSQEETLRAIESFKTEIRLHATSRIYVVAHSWGGIIAYLALQELSWSSPDTCVAGLVTMGSPVQSLAETVVVAKPTNQGSTPEMILTRSGDQLPAGVTARIQEHVPSAYRGQTITKPRIAAQWINFWAHNDLVSAPIQAASVENVAVDADERIALSRDPRKLSADMIDIVNSDVSYFIDNHLQYFEFDRPLSSGDLRSRDNNYLVNLHANQTLRRLRTLMAERLPLPCEHKDVSSWVVSPRRAGPVSIGMTVKEAESVVRTELSGDPPNPQCYYVSLAHGSGGVSFMVEGGRIARVDITTRTVRTEQGAEVGMTEEEILRIYGSRAVVSPHKYLDSGHYITVDPKAAYQTQFATDGKRVTEYRAGKFPAVQYVEGCL